MLASYARFIVRYSYLVLFIVSVVSSILTAIPLLFHKLPSFSDPTVGFETRGTTLAHRFIAWNNLKDETRPSGKLAVDPKEIEDQIRMNQSYQNRVRQDKTRSGRRRLKKKNRTKKKKLMNNTTGLDKNLFHLSEFNTTGEHVHWDFGVNVTFENENVAFLKNHTRKQWISLKEMESNPGKKIHPEYASDICGSALPNYAHLVVTTSDNTSLLSFENIKKMCSLQSYLVELGGTGYYDRCIRAENEELCCSVWSVPNYIALLSGKNSCETIVSQDVHTVTVLLKKCAGYFHNFTLMESCDRDQCKVPKYCSQHNAVYNLLFYLIDSDAFSPTNLSQSFVKTVMLFLPLASGSKIIPYYKKLQNTDLKYNTLVIPAIDFGLKDELFDIWIIHDTWLIGLGGIFVFVGVWVYTRTIILTLLLFIAITYSLGVAYFFYIYVFNLEFFPFMNLLVIVVVIGIGADDAFLYVKVWKMIGKQLITDNVENQGNGLPDAMDIAGASETILRQILEETMKHSMSAMFITTLTTAVAFYASYVSYIPAINCFSVFAGTAVLVNFLLIIFWLPVSVFIIDVKMCIIIGKFLDIVHKNISEMWEDIRIILNRFIIACVTKLHIVFVIILGALGIGSIVIVFYFPGLQLPDSKEFQLYQTSHPFEQYDLKYKRKFIFERLKSNTDGMKMPLRWVWGIEAIDNGNHMDPSSKGHIVFDKEFSISDPESQLWLLGFCARVKAQPFYQHTVGALLPNCFIETFKMYMSRRCIDNIDKINRTPCCESSTFPYKKEIFDFCIIKAMESLYQTPKEIFEPGVAGPKFLRSARPTTVAAIIVEFESVVPYSMSYTAMNNFFIHMENWTQEELKSAPKGMSNGWFSSELQFYDLQKTLASGTVVALLLSATLGFLVLIPATLSIIISICALTAMIFSSTATIAVLVLCDWKLNILESIAISTSAGLAVDFSLHYALSFTNASGTRSARVKYALSASAGPTAAAALTTGLAGIFLLHSNLLPYSQIGIFLALIMILSWSYATFFLCSLLHIVGQNSSKETQPEERKSVSRVSSICSEVPNLESHELEHLADSNHTNFTHSQSPSSISATTVVVHDDYDNSQNKHKTSVTNNLVCDND